MAEERTLSIIKPDAISMRAVGRIIAMFEAGGLRVGAVRMLKLTAADAAAFYAEHVGKPFYRRLTEFMTSGPIIVMVLVGENAVARTRDLMGATDFIHAAPDTVRRRFATSVTINAVHGSDSPSSAAREIAFFFKDGVVH